MVIRPWRTAVKTAATQILFPGTRLDAMTKVIEFMPGAPSIAHVLRIGLHRRWESKTVGRESAGDVADWEIAACVRWADGDGVEAEAAIRFVPAGEE